MKRRIKNALLVLICSVLVGVVLLMVTYSLPVEKARKHVEESLHTMTEIRYGEEASPFRKRVFESKDSFTDYLMVQNTLESVEGKNILEHAMYAYHYDLGNEATWMTRESLEAFAEQGSEGMYLREYSRYWHGYLIWLKPLLMSMSWALADNFVVVAQVLMLLAVVLLALRKKRIFSLLAILVAFLYMKPLGVWYSFTLSACWGIIMLALLADLIFYEQIEKRKLREVYFLMIGILTAYFDFLTYPIATLGVPLCFYIAGNKEKFDGLWRQLVRYFWMAASWCVGYAGMWGMKWVVADLTVQSGTLRNAIWSVIFRAEPLDGYSSAFSGSSRTFLAVMRQYDSVYYWVGFGVILLAAFVSFLCCLIKTRRKEWAVSMIALLGVAMFPIVWMFLIQNHTAIHCSFTFRIMSVTVAALCSMTVCSVRTLRESGNAI